jgi:hypothetical protein
LAALVAGYGTSTALGTLATRNAGGPLRCIFVGVGIAIATLVVGVVALGSANVFFAWLDDRALVRSGFGPSHSLGAAFEGFVLRPTITVVVFGGWIAVVFGIAYGTLLHWSGKSAHSKVSAV